MKCSCINFKVPLKKKISGKSEVVLGLVLCGLASWGGKGIKQCQIFIFFLLLDKCRGDLRCISQPGAIRRKKSFKMVT